MKEKIIITSGLFVAILIGMMATGFVTKNKISIAGAWRVAEVQIVKPNNTYSSVFPGESEVLFTKNYYSLCWTNHISTTRNWQIPDSAKLARINQSIVNTGMYELNDSILVTKASFAMNPMFVDGVAKFKCSYSGDTLVLTGLSVFSSDNIPHPVYAGGSHIVNKLVKLREE